jgi:sugar/nucleoside kinase (ribokinase family)
MKPTRQTDPSTNPGRVVLCGDGCLNIILQISRALKRGENTDITQTVRRPGGNALVTALELSRLGIASSYYGDIGNDRDGLELKKWMKTLNLDFIAGTSKTKTRLSYPVIDDSDRTILDSRYSPGQEPRPRPGNHLSRLTAQLREAKAILVDRYCWDIHETVRQTIGECRKRGEKPLLAYRTGSRPSDALSIEDRMIPASDIVFTKMSFMKSAGFGLNPIEALKKMSRRFKVPIIITTLGAQGASYYDAANDQLDLLPAAPLEKVLATLGGGDFFRAGFMAAYLEGKTLRQSVLYGNATAATHCGRAESEDPASLFFPREEVEHLRPDQTSAPGA